MLRILKDVLLYSAAISIIFLLPIVVGIYL